MVLKNIDPIFENNKICKLYNYDIINVITQINGKRLFFKIIFN